MALFYKYAKALNEIHRRSQAGESKEELSRLSKELYNETDRNKEEVRKAQEQLVIYSPFVEKELAKPEYDGKRISSLYFSMGLGTPEQIETYNNVLDECIKRYNISEAIKEPGQLKLANFTPEEQADITALAPTLDKIIVPLDRVNKLVFDFEQLMQIKTNGQLVFNTNTEESGVICAINFDALEDVEISKKLTIYDKRVFEVIGTIARNHRDENRPGKPVTSLTQIYKSMGYLNKPNKRDLDKIEASLKKMNFTGITLNNINVYVEDEDGGHKNVGEAKSNKKIDNLCYTGQFLSVGFIESSFKGQTTNKAIIIKEEPPLMTYAIGRNHSITTIKTALLESPISKTEKALIIEDYLIRRIAQIKRGGTSNHIKLNTLMESCRIKEAANHRGETSKKVEIFLAHFKKCEWIKGFKSDGETIEILF